MENENIKESIPEIEIIKCYTESKKYPIYDNSSGILETEDGDIEKCYMD